MASKREIALVLVRLDHVARTIVNADHGIMRMAAMFCVGRQHLRVVTAKQTLTKTV